MHAADDAFEDERPSKTRMKKAMTALQDLGEQLVALSPERLKKVPLPDNLLHAVKECQRFANKHEARRRQLQYIGRLMRDVDPAPIQAVLDAFNGQSAAATAEQHRLERLRTRLMESEAVLTEIGDSYPGADLQRIRQLRRNALKEQEQGKPPRSYRELFRELRALAGARPAADDAMPDTEPTEESDT